MEERVVTLERRARVFRTLEGTGQGAVAKWLTLGLVALILLNVLALILESVAAFRARYGTLFQAFEAFSVAVFSVEYAARVWSATSDPRYRHPVTGRLRFAATPLAIIDLVAILPAYVAFAVAGTGADLRFLRALRLFRLLRVFKLGRYSESMGMMRQVLTSKREALTVSVAVIAVLLVVTASLMHVVEHDAQPEAFGSIPAAMWWAIVTLTSIGYGDVVPVTPFGRALGSVTAVLGVAMVAIPTAILASGFTEALENRGGRACPHCGRDVDAPGRREAVPVARDEARDGS